MVGDPPAQPLSSCISITSGHPGRLSFLVGFIDNLHLCREAAAFFQPRGVQGFRMC